MQVAKIEWQGSIVEIPINELEWYVTVKGAKEVKAEKPKEEKTEKKLIIK